MTDIVEIPATAWQKVTELSGVHIDPRNFITPVEDAFARYLASSEAEISRLRSERDRLRQALVLWDESALMTDYDEEGRASPRNLDELRFEGGDIQMAAKATRTALSPAWAHDNELGGGDEL